LPAILADGQLIQRVANRAQALLAWDRGERIVEMVRWLGWSRMGLWDFWPRYQAWGVAASFDAECRGRLPGFSPRPRVQIERSACTDPRAYRLHLAR
jgi:hypothetical protein